MKHELHEEILLFLYDFRKTEDKPDVFEKFKGENVNVLKETIEELSGKDFIEVEYPFVGFGSLNWHTGEMKFPHADPNDFRKCKIKTAGIEYVKQNLLKKTDTLDKVYKIIAIAGVIGTVVIGAVTLVRESKYREEKQLNKDLQSSIDSIKQLQRANEIEHENLLGTKDKTIELLTSKVDSLTSILKAKSSKKAP